MNEQTRTIDKTVEKSKSYLDKLIRITTEDCEVIIMSNNKSDTLQEMNKLAVNNFKMSKEKKNKQYFG